MFSVVSTSGPRGSCSKNRDGRTEKMATFVRQVAPGFRRARFAFHSSGDL